MRSGNKRQLPATGAPQTPRRRGLLLGGAVAALGLPFGLWMAGKAWTAHGGGAADALADAVDALWQARFSTPDGQAMLALKSLKGSPALINFWATWCAPCVDELPLLDGFFAKNKANGLQVAGLAMDRPDAVARFLARAPVAYPVGIVPAAQGLALMKRLGNPAGGLPFTLALDGQGVLRKRKLGAIQAADLPTWRQALRF
ncbi:MAG: TlpA family protein disulfide reductase [Burkholderiaceae bacterium]|jgi:thiol-disulfide isomerase/thioredoxin|nr:TlpA family protein disulfide reductase [Burkholderiaceae bacterium]